jgi:hypothetical protein
MSRSRNKKLLHKPQPIHLLLLMPLPNKKKPQHKEREGNAMKN